MTSKAKSKPQAQSKPQIGGNAAQQRINRYQNNKRNRSKGQSMNTSFVMMSTNSGVGGLENLHASI